MQTHLHLLTFSRAWRRGWEGRYKVRRWLASRAALSEFSWPWDAAGRNWFPAATGAPEPGVGPGHRLREGAHWVQRLWAELCCTGFALKSQLSGNPWPYVSFPWMLILKVLACAQNIELCSIPLDSWDGIWSNQPLNFQEPLIFFDPHGTMWKIICNYFFKSFPGLCLWGLWIIECFWAEGT